VDGEVVARGGAARDNHRSTGGRPADALTRALRAALSTVDATRIAGGVVGAAGAGAAGRAAAQRASRAAWRAAGLAGEVVTVTDLEVADAAGTPAAAGLLLLAGTGAVAAAIRDGVVRHRCDGYGWLLGDEGSAVWIGREGLRAVLAAIDGRAAPTALTGLITAHLTGADAPAGADAHAQALLAAAYAMPPAGLGALAPLVGAAAAEGDPAAREITDAAVDRLLHALSTVARHGDATTVVLSGSVLLAPGPVGEGVRVRVRKMLGVAPCLARDGATGAAVLALARLSGGPVPSDVHARLTGA
jgi:N-acetylglucosamine kinase-like BadF-type ATPase